MKTYRWFFLMLVSSILVSCGGTSEDELVGDWQLRAFFRATARSHAATFVIGDKGYMCCGWSGSSRVRRNDVFVFDHTQGDGMGSWTQLADFPGSRRSHAVGFSIGGFGYIGTGWDGDETDMKDFWRYNPNNDEWEEVAPLPEKASIRRGAIAFSLTVGGKEYGYVGFGYYDDGMEDNQLLDLWQFDPENGEKGSWTEVLGYGGGKREGAAVFIIENRAYICNGKSKQSSSVNDFWMFDPNGTASGGKMWTKLRQMADANPDEDYDDDYGGLGRAYGVAYVAPVNGQLRGHIVGGGKNSNWEYDHEQDLWFQRTQFYNYKSGTYTIREGMVSFSFPNRGRAFVGMGKAGTNAFMEDMWEFFPLLEDDIYSDVF